MYNIYTAIDKKKNPVKPLFLLQSNNFFTALTQRVCLQTYSNWFKTLYLNILIRYKCHRKGSIKSLGRERGGCLTQF